MPLFRAGTWGIGGIKLPEFGITERISSALGQQRTPQGGSNLFGPMPAPAKTPSTSRPIYGPQPVYGPTLPQGNVLGSQAPQGGGGGGGGGNPQQNPPQNQNPNEDINNQVNDFSNQINQDYETQMGALSGQESGLKGQADVATQAINTQAGQAKTSLGEAQATQEAGLNKEQQTAQTQSASALQQSRDLFKQLQQQNIAQLSGMGISSSSVQEALAEKLGVETARRIAGITGSTNEVMQNIAQERTRVQGYYANRKTDIENTATTQLGQIQQSLLQGLNQINTARQMAANDKASRRQELFTNAQNAISQIQQNAQQFQQALDMWNAQKQGTLADAAKFVFSPTDTASITRWNDQVMNMPSIQGFQNVPTYDVNSQGYLKPGISTQKKPQEIVNPFDTP